MAALTAAMVALTAAGALSGAANDVQGGAAARRQGEYQSKVFGIDADLAERQADDAIARGHEAELRAGRQGKQIIGAQRAAYAASGVDVSSGTPAAVEADTQALSELDALTIKNNAALEAWGYRVQAADYRTKAQMALAAGRNEQTRSQNRAIGTLLSGALETYGQFKRSK
jgi:hypothetical protein